MQKLNYVDSLRGVAILMVMLVHTRSKISGLPLGIESFSSYGQMGVQLFFVISAYTLCLSASRRKDEQHQLVNYFIRRYFRIAPLYYVGIIIYIVIRFLQYKGNLPSYYTPLNIFANLTFIHGFYPPANNHIVPGGWSIGTEMTFYAIFPILFNLLEKRSLRTAIKLFFLSVGFSFSIELLLVFFLHKPFVDNSFLYFNIVNQLPVFILGILLFKLQEINFLDKWHIVFDYIFFLLFTALCLLLWHSHLPLVFFAIPILAGISFIFLFNIFSKVERLNVKPLTKLGRVSFSAYILHFIFAYILAEKVNRIVAGRMNSSLLLLLLFAFTVFGTFILASITERLVEKPGAKLGVKLINAFHNTPDKK